MKTTHLKFCIFKSLEWEEGIYEGLYMYAFKFGKNLAQQGTQTHAPWCIVKSTNHLAKWIFQFP